MPITLRIMIRAARQWSANGDSRLGAALAYYALFSFAPLLVIAVTIAGAVFGEDAARGQVELQLSGAIGKEAAAFIQRMVEAAAQPRSGQVAPWFSLAVLVAGALGMFLHMRGALCTIWKLEPPRGSTMLGILLDYTLALTMVIFCGILLIASLATNLFVRIFEEALDAWIPNLPWDWVELGLSFLYLTILFAAMYRILSGARISFLHVLYGSFIAAILFTLGKSVLGWYFVYSSPASIYGAAGTLVVFLIWVYYSAQILFFGAELIQAGRTRHEWLNGHVKK
jgi:membrane protein